MNKKDKDVHLKIEDRLLCMMDDIDIITTSIFQLRHSGGYDYHEHLNKLSEIKSDTKRILNKDFDKLAIARKE